MADPVQVVRIGDGPCLDHMQRNAPGFLVGNFEERLGKEVGN